jgi:hypothetical protein
MTGVRSGVGGLQPFVVQQSSSPWWLHRLNDILLLLRGTISSSLLPTNTPVSQHTQGPSATSSQGWIETPSMGKTHYTDRPAHEGPSRYSSMIFVGYGIVAIWEGSRMDPGGKAMLFVIESFQSQDVVPNQS